MISNMTINVEFLAGTSIDKAIRDAKEKANTLNLAYVHFTFNGVPFSIGRGCKVNDAVVSYEKGGIHHFCFP